MTPPFALPNKFCRWGLLFFFYYSILLIKILLKFQQKEENFEKIYKNIKKLSFVSGNFGRGAASHADLPRGQDPVVWKTADHYG
jgi:hypothetical protein